MFERLTTSITIHVPKQRRSSEKGRTGPVAAWRTVVDVGDGDGVSAWRALRPGSGLSAEGEAGHRQAKVGGDSRPWLPLHYSGVKTSRKSLYGPAFSIKSSIVYLFIP